MENIQLIQDKIIKEIERFERVAEALDVLYDDAIHLGYEQAEEVMENIIKENGIYLFE